MWSQLQKNSIVAIVRALGWIHQYTYDINRNVISNKIKTAKRKSYNCKTKYLRKTINNINNNNDDNKYDAQEINY